MVCREPFYEYSRHFVTPDIIVGLWKECDGSDGTPVTTGVTVFPHCLAGCNLEINCDLGTLRTGYFLRVCLWNSYTLRIAIAHSSL